MNEKDRDPIFTIAIMAALADGTATAAELERVRALGTALGAADLDAIAGRVALGSVGLPETVSRLSGPEAKKAAWEAAVAVVMADGVADAREKRFLDELRGSLAIGDGDAQAAESRAADLAGSSARPLEVVEHPAGTPRDAGLDDLILQQSIATAACELLPDRLANLAILPLQARLVYRIGQANGQALDAEQAKDLMGALGLGAAAQIAETVVRRVLGGVAGGILGRAVGGLTGVAAGAAVTFASTWALGHAAKQYYAQGRQLSADDLRKLFERFRGEAIALYPKVREQVEAQAKSLDLEKILKQSRA
ncbi:MAG: TerB family tellurite resistance protein [Alphaproteobacteria bacterium]